MCYNHQMEWVLLLWFNTEHAVVDHFRDIRECESRMRTYMVALKQAGSEMTVRCEFREKRTPEKNPNEKKPQP